VRTELGRSQVEIQRCALSWEGQTCVQWHLALVSALDSLQINDIQVSPLLPFFPDLSCECQFHPPMLACRFYSNSLWGQSNAGSLAEVTVLQGAINRLRRFSASTSIFRVLYAFQLIHGHRAFSGDMDGATVSIGGS